MQARADFAQNDRAVIHQLANEFQRDFSSDMALERCSRVDFFLFLDRLAV